jgi:hypothetical protein
MNKLLAVAALPVLSVALAVMPAAAGNVAPPSVADDGKIVLVGGMGSGGGGGMGGGSAGGMGGGGGGMSGSAGGGMSGGRSGYGNMYGSPLPHFGESAQDQTGSGGQNYTYQCVTLAGRCSFVAPAALRDNALRTGADCACGDGQSKGRVE